VQCVIFTVAHCEKLSRNLVELAIHADKVSILLTEKKILLTYFIEMQIIGVFLTEPTLY
jgi:hypothetical protein